MMGSFYPGFRYSDVDIVMRHRGFDADAFAGLQIMEQEAIRIMNGRD